LLIIVYYHAEWKIITTAVDYGVLAIIHILELFSIGQYIVTMICAATDTTTQYESSVFLFWNL